VASKPPSTARRRTAAGGRSDLVDLITDESLAEIPDLDRVELELSRRAGRLAAILQEAMARTLAAWGFTRAEYGLVTSLRSVGAPYELRPNELRARLLLTSGGVSNGLRRLERDGFIKRSRDAADGRGAVVRLTPKGVKTADEMIAAWGEDQTVALAGAPREALVTASAALREILVGLGDLAPPRVG
jgi:DNA-binding MarR family transcriptional regulator